MGPAGPRASFAKSIKYAVEAIPDHHPTVTKERKVVCFVRGHDAISTDPNRNTSKNVRCTSISIGELPEIRVNEQVIGERPHCDVRLVFPQ